jgi:hypothetical protein
MSFTTILILGIVYIAITGTSMAYPYRCQKSPFVQIVLSILPVFNLFYLLWRVSLCNGCSSAVHANVFFSSGESYEHYLREKEKYKQMRSSFDAMRKGKRNFK